MRTDANAVGYGYKYGLMFDDYARTVRNSGYELGKEIKLRESFLSARWCS